MNESEAWERLARDVGEFGADGLTAAAVADLAAAVLALSWQVKEARAWAWGYEHRMFDFDVDQPPEWLTSAVPCAMPPPRREA